MTGPVKSGPRRGGSLLLGVLGVSLLLLLSMGAVVPPAPGAPVPTSFASQTALYRLSVNVTTDAPVGPLPGAAVYLNGTFQGTTTGNGTLSLGTFPPSEYAIEVEASRYQTVNVSLRLTGPEELTVHLNSSETPGVLTGSYAPAGAAFTVLPYPQVRPTASTATTAFFELLLPPGTYNYTLIYHGEIQRGEFLIDTGKTLTLPLSLPPAGPGNASGSPWTNPYVETGLVVLGVGLGVGLVLAVTLIRRRKTPPRGPPPAGQT